MPRRSEAAVTRTSGMAHRPSERMGPPPRSLATDAHDCIMVGSLRSTEYKVVARAPRLAGSPWIALRRAPSRLAQCRMSYERKVAMMSLDPQASAVLAAVQDASRRLRRCRKRHPGRRLRAALCRTAGRDEGMAERSNQGMEIMPLSPSARPCGRDRTAPAVRAKCTRHRAGDLPRCAVPAHGCDRADATRRSACC
jgi:hypothetical protein